jgi:3-oxoacyl-[acyl-carrier-protein] synthase-3
VPAGGFRHPRDATTAVVETIDSSGNVRSAEHLYMNGAAIMTFTLGAVPAAIDQVLARAGASLEDHDAVVLHQASAFILDRLRQQAGDDPEDRFVVAHARPRQHRFVHHSHGAGTPGPRRALRRRVLLVGFGVGYSWAAAQALIGEP